MKTLLLACALFLTMSLVTTNSAQAQTKANVGQLVSGLVNVNVGAVNVDAHDLIDVNNVLNQNDIRILDNVLNHSPIASYNSDILTNVATNLLRDANIITGDQIAVVVGVLSGIPVYQVMPAPLP